MNGWSGEVVIVNGPPRNPKCQGLIEQGNIWLRSIWECDYMNMMGNLLGKTFFQERTIYGRRC